LIQVTTLEGRALKILVYDVFLNRHQLIGHVVIPLNETRVAATPCNRCLSWGDIVPGGDGGDDLEACKPPGESGDDLNVYWADLISRDIVAPTRDEKIRSLPMNAQAPESGRGEAAEDDVITATAKKQPEIFISLRLGRRF
jgi:hypothetical protein